jgi:Histidine phosphatase superfamily (branch 1)
MFRCSSSCRCSSDKSSQTKSKTLRHNCKCNIIRQQQRQQTSVSSSVLIVVYAIFMLTTLSRNINTSNAFILLPKQATISTSVAKSVVSLNCPTGWFTKLYQSTKKTTESVLPVIDTMDTIPNIPPLPKTAKRVYWIRHGEVINPGAGQNKSVFYGSMDVPLSSFGQEEAIAAGKFLSQQDIVGPLSNVYSSNLTRAIYGAEQVRIRQHQAQDETSSAPSEVIQVPGFMESWRMVW